MDRIAVVTGALSGLGEATCAALEADGDRVIRVDIANSDVNADLATPEGRQDALRRIAELAPDRIDAVVTWAGGGGETVAMLCVNYFGTTDIVDGLRPLLARSAAPRVVVTSSRMTIEPADETLVDLLLTHDEARIVADYGDEQVPLSYYVAAKTAVARWMRRNSILPVWNEAGIRINAIAPGFIETQRTRTGMEDAAAAKWMIEAHPQAEDIRSQPSEIGVLARFLASPENSLLIGQCIFADRGTEAILRGDRIW
ncbi:NAD(P)-dependent dehydrogenase (short-subunit alcohol dehydrogenase family) [Sphingobium xenophagum]|uniref:NAD(P)-dependent dehydrogenase (Short-subunit alcohol dehydrogenase family) n=1 Tax=Sphingobium xenophagum TaxID=121428 RepID=A0ABU1X5A2_SPHXE|nr:SDR family oxidoreductase [Sphingobium xenophagum]MDR7156474.1 NAD(P)-dependent dehydrogenase (short-subunit alcohol dehydrogenase family) [Sphingobium xenophagum]